MPDQQNGHCFRKRFYLQLSAESAHNFYIAMPLQPQAGLFQEQGQAVQAYRFGNGQNHRPF